MWYSFKLNLPSYFVGLLIIITLGIIPYIVWGNQLKPYIFYTINSAPKENTLLKVEKYSYAIFQNLETLKYFSLDISNLEYDNLIIDFNKNTKLEGYKFIGAIQTDVK